MCTRRTTGLDASSSTIWKSAFKARQKVVAHNQGAATVNSPPACFTLPQLTIAGGHGLNVVVECAPGRGQLIEVGQHLSARQGRRRAKVRWTDRMHLGHYRGVKRRKPVQERERTKKKGNGWPSSCGAFRGKLTVGGLQGNVGHEAQQVAIGKGGQQRLVDVIRGNMAQLQVGLPLKCMADRQQTGLILLLVAQHALFAQTARWCSGIMHFLDMADQLWEKIWKRERERGGGL